MPNALILPKVGLNPTTPQYAAGRIVDPPVCEPIAAGHIRAATAAPEPLLDPPGVCARFHGLQVGVGAISANSVVAVLPRMMAPARFRRATTAESNWGTN